jgi:uncharacterized Zn-binding protein involved in type VI secretion
MPPAARVSDTHTCPAHGGGPISLPGCATVLIGNLPAARLSDLAACGNSPDTIVTGAATVLIGNLPAARQTDNTAHGGVITLGFATVLIGGATIVIPAIFAIARKKPSAAQHQSIAEALRMHDYQRAIALTVQAYDIDISNVPNGPKWDATESNYGTTAFNGSMALGPEAMKSADVLASTIVHETTHANQAAALRSANPHLADWPDAGDDSNYDEAGAYASELHSADNTGIHDNAEEHQLCDSRRHAHYRDLPREKQVEFDNGKYPP